MKIDASGSEALYDVTLPPAVYQGVTRRDLGDVRVFNGAGEVVPMAWRPRRTEKTDAGASVPLTLFALKAAAGTSVDGLAINVTRAANGALSVNVKSTDAAAVAQHTIAYLIDMSAHERALRTIAQIEVLVRDKAEQPWRSIARAVAYRLNQSGSEVQSPDIRVHASGER